MSSDDVSALGQEAAETREAVERILLLVQRATEAAVALAKLERKYVTAKNALLKERDEANARAVAAEAERDEARLSSHSFWKLASDMWEKRARAAEAAHADTREALRNLLAWADETVEAITQEYSDYDTADETAQLEAARAVLAAVPPQQGAPADTDARPANNAGTRGGGA